MSPDSLQNTTAMAILGLAVAAGIAIAKSVFERMFKQIDEYFQFVREQSEKADERQAGQLTAWIDAHKEQIVAGAAQAEALGRIQQTQVEIQKTQVEIHATLQRLNGKGE